MHVPSFLVASLVGVVGLGALAAGRTMGDEPVGDEPVGDEPVVASRVEVLPARQVWEERTEVIPEVTRDEMVPVFETVKVPVYATQRVPITEQREVPVLGTREVPVVEERRVAEHGPVTVPTYEHRRVPVTLSIPNPFDCDDFCIELWDRCECVPNGTRVETGVVGWRAERVQVGTRQEAVVTGTRSETVTVGERFVNVVVGEREERRQVGTETRRVVVRPAQTRTSRVCVERPAESVTVVADGREAHATPLPGTTRVISESELAPIQPARQSAAQPTSQPEGQFPPPSIAR
jgi:hypothetical protein